MKTVLARTAACTLALMILAACLGGAALPSSTPNLSTITTILWLLGAGGAICLLLRRVIDAEDRARDLAARLVREQGTRQATEDILADTQTVLSKVVRQQETVRDSERARIARDIDDELGQTLLTLRVELSLLQVSTSGIHPGVHQKTGSMIGTLDLALHSLRVVVNELRPLALDEGLRAALTRQCKEFTHLNGIPHQLEIAPGALREQDGAAGETDALLYRVLQEALAAVAHAATATEVRIALQRAGNQLSLRIDDNGSPGRRGGAGCACGMAGMRERVEALGGALRMAAGAGGGNVLALTLPLGGVPAPAELSIR